MSGKPPPPRIDWDAIRKASKKMPPRFDYSSAKFVPASDDDGTSAQKNYREPPKTNNRDDEKTLEDELDDFYFDKLL